MQSAKPDPTDNEPIRTPYPPTCRGLLVQLIDHVSISVRDIGRAQRFYAAILSALGAVVAYGRDDAIGLSVTRE
jgi:hypothetical protein